MTFRKFVTFVLQRMLSLYSLIKVSIFLLTDTDYLFDKVSEQIVLTKKS